MGLRNIFSANDDAGPDISTTLVIKSRRKTSISQTFAATSRLNAHSYGKTDSKANFPAFSMQCTGGLYRRTAQFVLRKRKD
ncbi:MAG: hypothetical protein IPH12_11345 [Saprospirales bacterium]|nr:hypothetical protein [Saprospirales bacterium]MBK8919919.1 hypothetical protein [Saprospirales bacterium]